jgi:ArsR family metal-binding transcriptional regulator
MLIQSLVPEVVLPPCDHTRETVSVIGRFQDDISPVLPYLNATQPKAIYNRAANILRFRFERHQATLQPHEMALGGFEDGDQALEALFRLQGLINATWEQRDEITPSTVERKRLQALAVYRLLPGTNCRECGEPTCFVFAGKLAAGQVDVWLCAPLCREEADAEKRDRLMAMLESSA